MLSELYLLSAVLKRFHDERRPSDDAPIVRWCCESGYARIETALVGVIDNFPLRPLAWLVRMVTLPLGVRSRGPDDATTQACAERLMQPGAGRDRLTPGVFLDAAAMRSPASSARSISCIGPRRCGAGCARQASTTMTQRLPPD